MNKSDHLSVNYHLLEACNMRCRFCFATFEDINRSKRKTDMALAIIHELAAAGFRKITFAGGEPTLRQDVPILLETARKCGMTNMLVTNGSRILDPDYYTSIAAHLDWLVLSIDSFNEETNLNSGRFLSGERAISANEYQMLCDKAKRDGLKLKINTVVSRFNRHENMSESIKQASPNRWKLFQALPVEGQNSDNSGQFEVSTAEFNSFLKRHRDAGLSDVIIPEDNDAMTGSYVMVAPNGCFFDNSRGYHTYSSPILKVGVCEALKQIQFDLDKFHNRGGLYPW